MHSALASSELAGDPTSRALEVDPKKLVHALADSIGIKGTFGDLRHQTSFYGPLTIDPFADLNGGNATREWPVVPLVARYYDRFNTYTGSLHTYFRS